MIKIQNDSIKKRSNFIFAYSIIQILALFIFGACLFLNQVKSKKLNIQNQEILYSLNTLVSEIYSLKDFDFASPQSIGIKEYQRLQNTLAQTNKSLKKNLKLDPPYLSSQIEYKNYLKQIRLFGQVLRNNQVLVNKKDLLKLQFLLILILFFSFLHLISLILWKKKHNIFLNTISQGIETLNKTILFQDQLEINNEKLAESKQFLSTIKQLDQEILFSQKLYELNSNGDLNYTLKKIYSLLNKQMSCHRVALAFLNKDGTITAESAYTEYQEIYLQPGFTESFSAGSLKKLIQNKNFRIINDLKAYSLKHSTSKSTQKILKEGICSSITLPIFFEKRCVGFVFISSKNKNAFSQTKGLMAQRLVQILKQKLYMEYIIQGIISDTTTSFISVMKERDYETSHHLKRMAKYSHIIAQSYSKKIQHISPQLLRAIYWYAPLHDIGKVGIPDDILNKKGSLNQQERVVMESHVQIGENLIKTIEQSLKKYFDRDHMTIPLQIISSHHEKFDGSGYPRGLKGDQIPLAGRIIILADIFDALTSKRSYKEAFPFEEAVRLISTEMKHYFDPDILLCFLDSIDKIKAVYTSYK